MREEREGGLFIFLIILVVYEICFSMKVLEIVSVVFRNNGRRGRERRRRERGGEDMVGGRREE